MCKSTALIHTNGATNATRLHKQHIFEYYVRLEKDSFDFHYLRMFMNAWVQQSCDAVRRNRYHNQSIKKGENKRLYLVPLNDFVINESFILCRLRMKIRAITFGSDAVVAVIHQFIHFPFWKICIFIRFDTPNHFKCRCIATVGVHRTSCMHSWNGWGRSKRCVAVFISIPKQT